MNLENILKKASQILKKNNINSHELDAQIILSKLMGVEREYLIIKDKINLGLDIGDELTMIKFEKSRKSQNFIFSIGSNFIKNFFDYDNKIFKIFANQALLKVNKNNGIKNFFINSADRGLIF